MNYPLSHRIFLYHSTYLGIRKFFLSSPSCSSQSQRTRSTHTQEDEVDALFSVASSTRVPAIARNLTAAEQEWLQEEQLLPTSSLPALLDPPDTTKRFDWRLRAPSRTRKPFPTTTPFERRKYIRRKQPPLVNLDEGECFYDAVQNYESQYVSFNCSSIIV